MTKVQKVDIDILVTDTLKWIFFILFAPAYFLAKYIDCKIERLFK